jgi:hypothetical protein
MDAQTKIEIVDKDGWRNEVSLPTKRLVQIGSDPKNDVILAAWRGAGVAPRHLQLLRLSGDEPRVRVVNLTDRGVAQVMLPAAEKGQELLLRSTIDLADGAQIRVGDFTLVLHLGEAPAAALPVAPPSLAPAPAQRVEPRAEPAPGPVAPPRTGKAPPIGLALDLPQTVLELDRPIEGTLAVRNQGSQAGVQFWLTLEGLEPKNYEMGPGPILFPNAERSVFLRLHHPRKPHPPAGEHEICIRATAPDAYPGKGAEVRQAIQIVPFYDHELRFVCPTTAIESNADIGDVRAGVDPGGEE